MELNVQIDAKTINDTIAHAIATSAIGEQLQASITKVVGELSRSYDNPIEKVVRSEVHKCIQDIITSEFGEQIKTAVHDKITDSFVTEIASKMWEHYFKTL